jgi:hypothetical protein
MKARTFQYYTILVATCISTSFYACNNSAPLTEFRNDRKEIILAPENDSTQVQTSIVSFLQWYKLNIGKTNKFSILINDSNGYFKVNRKAYTGYLDFIKSSSFVSDRYIDYWKIYFADKEDYLANQSIKTYVPEGFDFDFVLVTQEPELVLNNISNINFNLVSMNDTVALVALSLPGNDSITYEFEMYKGTEGWQIGYISTPNYD